MQKTSEYKAGSLEEVIRLATADYRRDLGHTGNLCVKNDRRCNDFILQITSLKQSIGRLGDDAEDLRREAQSLQRSGRGSLAEGILSALGGFAATFLRFRRISKAIERIRAGRFKRKDALELLNIIPQIVAVTSILRAAQQFNEAADLIRKAEQIEQQGQNLGQRLLETIDVYNRSGCGEGGAFS